MKFIWTLKSPESIDQVSLDRCFHTMCGNHFEYHNDCEDCRSVKDMNSEELACLQSLINKYLEYEEYVRIEFDTEKGTAVVLPCC